MLQTSGKIVLVNLEGSLPLKRFRAQVPHLSPIPPSPELRHSTGAPKGQAPALSRLVLRGTVPNRSPLSPLARLLAQPAGGPPAFGPNGAASTRTGTLSRRGPTGFLSFTLGLRKQDFVPLLAVCTPPAQVQT